MRWREARADVGGAREAAVAERPLTHVAAVTVSRPAQTDWRVAVGLVAVVFALALQAIRLVSPSLFGVFEELGYLAPAAIAGIVLALGPLVGPALIRSLGVRRAAVVAVGGLSVARLVVQAASDVPPWLAWATTFLAMASLTVVLAGAAAGGPRRVVAGLMLGAAIDVALRGAFHTWDPMWQPGVVPWLVAAAGAGAAIALVCASPFEREGRASFFGSIALGPFLFLHAVFLQNTGFVGSRAGIGVSASTAAIIVIDAGAIAVLGSFGRRWTAPLQLGTVLGGVAVSSLLGPVSLAGVAFATVGSAAMLVMAWSDPRRLAGLHAALATAGGALIFAALLVVYQKDRPLPLPGAVLPAAAAAVLAAVPAAARPQLAPAAVRDHQVVVAALGLLVVPLGLWAAAAPGGGTEPVSPASPTLVLLDYNVRFGVTTEDQLDPEAIARAIEVHDPSVVVLQEAGRGVPFGGMTDVVEWLSWRLEMPYVSAEQLEDRFRPTILYQPGMDVISSGYGTLAADSGPVRSYLRVAFGDVGGRRLEVVATHLSGPEEDGRARALQLRELLRAAGDPANTVIVGDLNVSLGSSEVAILRRAGFTPVQQLTGERDSTFPEDDTIIDHVLIGPGLTATDMVVPKVALSDHFPVVVTIART